MRETPILMCAENIPLLLDGSKTVTRRVAHIPQDWVEGRRPQQCGPEIFVFFDMADPIGTYPTYFKCPYGGPGDLLWIKTHLFMHKADAVIWREVTDARPERLQQITEEDAKLEGVKWLFTQEQCNTVAGIIGTKPEDHGYKNYLWHGNFGPYGGGNKQSDSWPYQFSSYSAARDSYSSLWQLLNGHPKRVKRNPYTMEREDCYVSYPWEDVRKVEPRRGLNHYVIGNCHVWRIAMKEIEK